jgi:hypothetical protein
MAGIGPGFGPNSASFLAPLALSDSHAPLAPGRHILRCGAVGHGGARSVGLLVRTPVHCWVHCRRKRPLRTREPDFERGSQSPFPATRTTNEPRSPVLFLSARLYKAKKSPFTIKSPFLPCGALPHKPRPSFPALTRSPIYLNHASRTSHKIGISPPTPIKMAYRGDNGENA